MKKDSQRKPIEGKKDWQKPACMSIKASETQGNSKSVGWTGPEGNVFIFWTQSPS